jgi:hypothetical protein
MPSKIFVAVLAEACGDASRILPQRIACAACRHASHVRVCPPSWGRTPMSSEAGDHYARPAGHRHARNRHEAHVGRPKRTWKCCSRGLWITVMFECAQLCSTRHAAMQCRLCGGRLPTLVEHVCETLRYTCPSKVLLATKLAWDSRGSARAVGRHICSTSSERSNLSPSRRSAASDS